MIKKPFKINIISQTIVPCTDSYGKTTNKLKINYQVTYPTGKTYDYGDTISTVKARMLLSQLPHIINFLQCSNDGDWDKHYVMCGKARNPDWAPIVKKIDNIMVSAVEDGTAQLYRVTKILNEAEGDKEHPLHPTTAKSEAIGAHAEISAPSAPIEPEPTIDISDTRIRFK